jgi:hypothetical protein
MKRNINTKYVILYFTIYTYQSTEVCLLLDPATRFGTVVSSSDVRVQFTFGIASAYYCYTRTVVKINFAIKIKILIGLNTIERCKIYVSVPAKDSGRLIHTFYFAARTTGNGMAVVSKRMVE